MEQVFWRHYMNDTNGFMMDDILVIQLPHALRKQDEVSKKYSLTIIKAFVSAVFSFGVFKDSIKHFGFTTRLRLYYATIIFWITIASFVGILVYSSSRSIGLSSLIFACISLLSYGAFQKIALEYKSLRFFKYNRDTSGLWDRSVICEIYNPHQKRLVDYLLPILPPIRSIVLLNKLFCCSQSISESDEELSKYLKHSLKDSEQLYIASRSSIYRIDLSER